MGTVFALPRNTTGGLGWRKHGPVQRLAAGPYRVCGAVGTGSSGMHALDHRAIRERGGPRRPAAAGGSVMWHGWTLGLPRWCLAWFVVGAYVARYASRDGAIGSCVSDDFGLVRWWQ